MNTNQVVKLLERHGPMLSSEVAGTLRNDGLTSTAARKIIQRAGPLIKQLRGVRFPHNVRFLYLEDQFGKDGYYEKLLDALDSTNSIFGKTIHALEGYGGLIPKYKFSILSGAPNRLKGQVGYERVLERLSALELIVEWHTPPIGNCIQFNPRTPFNIASPIHMKSKILAEEILLKGLTEWIKKNGFGSFKKVKVSSATDIPIFAQFCWDLTAPSYIFPLTTRSEKGVSPGFVVMDVNLTDGLDLKQVGYFIKKCEAIRNQKNSRPFLPFLIAQSFSKDAFRRGRGAGLVFTTPGNILGYDIGEGLKSLIEVLKNAAAVAASKPEMIVDLFTKLNKIEGAASNLRGPLFEMIVGHCVREIEGNTIDIGKHIRLPETGEEAEIDVFRVKERQEVCAYECKGYSPRNEVTEAEITKWLTTSIPRIFRWIQSEDRFRGCRSGFEFWTSGSFTKSALQKLISHKKATKKYTIHWREGSAVYDYVKNTRSKRIIELMAEHFIKHPLHQ